MTSADNKHREQLGKTKRGLQRKDRTRLLVMVAGLALAVFAFQSINDWGENSSNAEGLGLGPTFESEVALPPIDFEALSEVSDDTPASRVVLEPKGFQHLSKMSQALLPAHLTALNEPTLAWNDLDITAADFDTKKWRGKPVRMRGEVLHARQVTRSPGQAPEYWCLLRTESGKEFFYASMRMPEQLFGSENFALADGYFFKIYTQTIEEERLTLPLVIGRMLQPSARLAPPVTELDPVILADVRDAEHGEFVDLNTDAMWHLLNLSANQPEDKLFEAKWLDYDSLAEVAANPALHHGELWSFTGVVRDSWSESAGENPLRLKRITNAYLRNTEHGDHLIRIVMPGDFNTNPFAKQPEKWTGWFMQLWAYEDTQGRPRRTPVFVVADVQPISLEPGPFLGQMTYGFITLFVCVAGAMILVVKRDRKKSAEADAAWRAKRAMRLAEQKEKQAD